MAKAFVLSGFTLLLALLCPQRSYAAADLSIAAEIRPDTPCTNVPLTFRITIKNNGPDTAVTMLLRLGIFDSTITKPHRSDTNIFIERVLVPGDSFTIDVNNFWTNILDSITYLYTDIAEVPPNDSVPGNNSVIKPTCYKKCDCFTSRTWLSPREIQVEQYLQVYPDSAQLSRMRPGSTIAIYCHLLDSDYVKVTCTDNTGKLYEVIYGPFADHVLYDWQKDVTAPGQLFVPSGAIAEQNAVLYQLPKDASTAPAIFDVAIHLKVGNSPNTPKAIDVTIFGDISFGVRRIDDPQHPGQYLYDVTADIDSLDEAPNPLAENLIKNGACLPSITWVPLTPILLRHGPEYLRPDSTCGAVGLVYAEAIDQDSLIMECAAPDCFPDAFGELQNDPIYYVWSNIQGNGVFPLGADGLTPEYLGAVMPYFRPNNDTLTIFQVLLEDSHTQATEIGLFSADTVHGCVELPQQKVLPSFEDETHLSIVPQPADRGITARYILRKTEAIKVAIYDLNGKPVTAPLSGVQSAGPHEEYIYVGDLPSGIYLLSLTSDRATVTRRFEIVR